MRWNMWDEEFGVCVDGGGASLSSIDVDEVRASVLADGLAFLRGFEVTIDDLEALTADVFDRPLVYGGAREKVSEDDTIQTVDLGLGHLGLHVELGYVPVRPDLAVFHCQMPATDGGETTFGDGKAIFNALSPGTRDLLTSNRIRYHTVVRSQTWQRMFKIDSQEALLEIAAEMEDVEAAFDDVGDLHVDFLSTPVFERRGDLVYADSAHRFGVELEDEWVQGLKKTSSNLDSGPLPDEIRRELDMVCAAHERPAAWQPGDVVVIDNWSVLHGRTAFSDPNRRILASFGYADWARPGQRVPA